MRAVIQKVMRELIGASVDLIERQRLFFEEERRRICTFNRLLGKQLMNEWSLRFRLWRFIPFNEQLPSLVCSQQRQVCNRLVCPIDDALEQRLEIGSHALDSCGLKQF